MYSVIKQVGFVTILRVICRVINLKSDMVTGTGNTFNLAEWLPVTISRPQSPITLRLSMMLLTFSARHCPLILGSFFTSTIKEREKEPFS